jgi:hypothetical protein
MIVKYDKVEWMPDTQYPMWDLMDENDNPESSLVDVIAISNQYIQFYSPLPRDEKSDERQLITLKRDDSITGYTPSGETPLWKVIKEADGEITLWPSIIWDHGDGFRQHFWLSNNEAEVLRDSWIFQK